MTSNERKSVDLANGRRFDRHSCINCRQHKRACGQFLCERCMWLIEARKDDPIPWGWIISLAVFLLVMLSWLGISSG